MNNFYYKTDDGDYVQIELNKIASEDLSDGLMIVKVGTLDSIPTESVLNSVADAISSVRAVMDHNISVITLSSDIGITVSEKDEEKSKCIYLQIADTEKDEDIHRLEADLQNAYSALKGRHEVVILPTPIKIEEYNKVKSILKRSRSRKSRRRIT